MLGVLSDAIFKPEITTSIISSCARSGIFPVFSGTIKEIHSGNTLAFNTSKYHIGVKNIAPRKTSCRTILKYVPVNGGK